MVSWVMLEGTPGKRGASSLAPAFGLDRRDLARHQRECLVGGRRERAVNALMKSSGKAADPIPNSDEGGRG